MAKKITVILTSVFAIFMLCFGIYFGNSVFSSNAEEPTVATKTAVAVERAAAEPVANAETGVAPVDSTVAQIFKNNVAVANYDTLEAAVAAITADDTLGDTVKLIKAAKPTKSINLTVGLTLDLNSQSITFGGKIWLNIQNQNAEFTVKDGTVIYNGTTTAVPTVNVVKAKKTLISNLNVESASNYGIYIDPQCAGTTTIKDCKKLVAKKYAIDDAGSGKTDIINCTVENVPYAMYFASTVKKAISVTDCTINKATYGMYCAGSGNVTATDCTINNAAYGIFVPGSGRITVTNGTISNSTGSGLYIDSHCSGTTLDGVIIKDVRNGINDYSAGDTVIRNCKIFQFTDKGIYLEKSDETLVYHTEIFDEPETAAPAAETKTESWHYGIVQHGAGLLTVQDSKITFKTANSIGLSGNGSVPDAGITVINTQITAGYGVYHPEQGELIIDGGSITAKINGIEMRAGNLTIKNNTIITVPMDVEYTATENTNGNTITGAAVGISQHTTNKPINVTIEKATLSAPMALVQVDLELDKISGDPSPINIAVKDGEYEGKVQTERVLHFISGGEFGVAPKTDYLAEHFVSHLDENDKFLVVDDVDKEKQEAAYYVRLYAATKNLEYTEEINNIIFSSENYTSLLVAEAKKRAVAKVDELYSAVVTAKANAISAVKTAAAEDTAKSLEAVSVPTSTYAAINGATSVAEVEELKQNALAEIDRIRAKNASDKALGDKVDGIGGKVDGVGDKVDGVGDKIDRIPAGTATAGTNNRESENITGVYVMLAVSIAISAIVLVLVIVLLVKRKDKDDDKKEEAVKPVEEEPEATTEESVEESAPAEAAVAEENAPAEEEEPEEEEEESAATETEEELAEEQDEEHEAHEAEVGKDISVDPDVAAAGDAQPHIVRVHKTFDAKLKEASDQALEDYTMLKNEFCNYEGVKDRVCKYCESFHLGHKLIAKIKIIGRSVRLYLALDPSDYDEKKYHHADKSEIKSYAHVPMMVKVNGPRALSRAISLISDCLDGVKKNDEFVWVDFGEQIKKQAEQEKQAEQAAAQSEEKKD